MDPDRSPADAVPDFPPPLPPAAFAVGEEIRRAIAAGTRLRPRGAGTWWTDPGGGADARALRLAGLTHVTDLAPADLVVTVGAGCPLDALDRALRERGVWLALDPPGHRARTVGGVLSVGAGGPLAARYGAPRDQVLGMTVVAGNGTPVRMGGRVVKNVAGFDLAKVVVGGYGAFGAIVEAHLRLRAVPAADVSVAWTGSLRDVAAAARRVLAAGSEPAALEVLGPSVAGDLLAADAWALAIRQLGGRASVEEELAVVSGAVGASLRRHGVDGTAGFWLRWREIAGAWPVVLRVGADPSLWPDAIALAEEHIGPAAGVSATASRGTVRLGFPAVGAGALGSLREAAALHGWPVTLERADAALREAAGVWGALDPGVRRLAERLRGVFDPNRVFAVPLLA